MRINYGDEIPYEFEEKYQLPDFSIEFIGKKESQTPFEQKTITYFVYKISDSQTEKKIEYSGGFGILLPYKFELSGKFYTLNPIGANLLTIKLDIRQDESES